MNDNKICAWEDVSSGLCVKLAEYCKEDGKHYCDFHAAHLQCKYGVKFSHINSVTFDAVDVLNSPGKPKLGITHGNPNLSFPDLSRENANRCLESYRPIADWSVTDWATAMAGECGEACNIIKKIRRLQHDCSSQLPHDALDYVNLRQKAADEIADMVIYADLLCSRLGINLSHAVSKKFNETSEKIGSKRRL